MSRGLKIFLWSFVYIGIGAFHYLAMAYVPAFWTFDDWVRDNLKWFVQHFGSDLIDGLVFLVVTVNIIAGVLILKKTDIIWHPALRVLWVIIGVCLSLSTHFILIVIHVLNSPTF